MAVTLHADFETGSNGTVLTDANTPFDNVFGSPVVSTAQAVAGTRSMRIQVGSTGVQTCGQHNFTAGTSYFAQFFVRFAAIPAANTFLLLYSLAGGPELSAVRITPAGKIQVRDGGGAVFTSSLTVAPNAWYRIAHRLNGSTQEIRLWTGLALMGVTPTEQQAGLAYGGGNASRVNCGSAVSVANLDFFMDEITYDNSAFPSAPFTPPVVDIGADATIEYGASKSFTPSVTSSGTTTYLWTVAGPSGSSSQFSSTTSLNTTITPAGGPGTYTVTLTVTNSGGSTSDSAVLTVTPDQRMKWSRIITVSG